IGGLVGLARADIAGVAAARSPATCRRGRNTRGGHGQSREQSLDHLTHYSLLLNSFLVWWSFSSSVASQACDAVDLRKRAAGDRRLVAPGSPGADKAECPAAGSIAPAA